MVAAQDGGPRLTCEDPGSPAGGAPCICAEEGCCVTLDVDVIALVNFEGLASAFRGPISELLGRRDPARCDCLVVYRLPGEPGSIRVASIELKGGLPPEPGGSEEERLQGEARARSLARSLAWKHAACLGLAARVLQSLPNAPANVVYECYTLVRHFNPTAPIVAGILSMFKEEARRAFAETLRGLGLGAGSVRCANFGSARLLGQCCTGPGGLRGAARGPS
ncbi:MAG: hypothetical protein LRS49_04380 [Desulfurococcales archaeon]|nr:hypothetical protein [Desulfurococcales archaeon]